MSQKLSEITVRALKTCHKWSRGIPRWGRCPLMWGARCARCLFLSVHVLFYPATSVLQPSPHFPFPPRYARSNSAVDQMFLALPRHSNLHPTRAVSPRAKFASDGHVFLRLYSISLHASSWPLQTSSGTCNALPYRVNTHCWFGEANIKSCSLSYG